MTTIRGKLLLLLWLLLTGLIAVTGYWNYQNTRQELLNLFDSQLVQEGLTLRIQHQELKDLSTFVDHTEQESYLLDNIVHPESRQISEALPDAFTNHQLPRVFQILDKHQKLYEKSKAAPVYPLTNFIPGLSYFHESELSSWRIFTLIDDEGSFYVIAEPSHVRAMLVDNIALAQTIPMICLWLALLILGGWCIRWTLKPLEKISREISERHLDYLTPIDPEHIPTEARPMVKQINHLLARVEDGVAREKRFTADASHELRTPLAAVQVQAQVAMDAVDSNVRAQAVKKMMQGVERCTHVIHQLAILAKIRPQEPLHDVTDINLAATATEVIAELAPQAIEKQVDIRFNASRKKALIRGNMTLIRIMMRNIMDNAIRYSEPNRIVTVSILKKEKECLFQVNDQGPGIPEELRKRVFERFYRGLGHNATGSGLGLSIVEQIASLHQAKIELTEPEQGSGLCFTVSFPVPTP